MERGRKGGRTELGKEGLVDGLWRVKERMVEDEWWVGPDLPNLGGHCEFNGKQIDYYKQQNAKI